MAKGKGLNLEEIKRCVDLHKSYYNTKIVNVETLAKELGVKKLDLWEFITNNEDSFELHDIFKEGDTTIKWRFIENVLDKKVD